MMRFFLLPATWFVRLGIVAAVAATVVVLAGVRAGGLAVQALAPSDRLLIVQPLAADADAAVRRLAHWAESRPGLVARRLPATELRGRLVAAGVAIGADAPALPPLVEVTVASPAQLGSERAAVAALPGLRVDAPVSPAAPERPSLLAASAGAALLLGAAVTADVLRVRIGVALLGAFGATRGQKSAHLVAALAVSVLIGLLAGGTVAVLAGARAGLPWAIAVMCLSVAGGTAAAFARPSARGPA